MSKSSRITMALLVPLAMAAGCQDPFRKEVPASTQFMLPLNSSEQPKEPDRVLFGKMLGGETHCWVSDESPTVHRAQHPPWKPWDGPTTVTRYAIRRRVAPYSRTMTDDIGRAFMLLPPMIIFYPIILVQDAIRDFPATFQIRQVAADIYVLYVGAGDDATPVAYAEVKPEPELAAKTPSSILPGLYWRAFYWSDGTDGRNALRIFDTVKLPADMVIQANK